LFPLDIGFEREDFLLGIFLMFFFTEGDLGVTVGEGEKVSEGVDLLLGEALNTGGTEGFGFLSAFIPLNNLNSFHSLLRKSENCLSCSERYFLKLSCSALNH